MFENYVSLGNACHVAASMGKLGIRAFSGPFDWYVSSLKGVFECLDNDFEDFLCRDNLELSDNPRIFKDKKYDFIFQHEIKTTLDVDYAEIYEKYQRRIDNFRARIKENTCFIRAISNNDIGYVEDNEKWIDGIVKKSNENNEIIYVVVNAESGKELDFPFFKAEYAYCSWFGRRSLRSLFDNSEKLREFLLSNYDEKRRIKNLVFDLQAENERLRIPEYIYVLLNQIEDIDVDKIDIPQNIVIYGAGNVGKAFCRKIQSVSKVDCFVDRNPKASEYNGIPIMWYKEFIESKFRSELVVITPTYILDEIVTDLTNDNVKNVVSVEKYFMK